MFSAWPVSPYKDPEASSVAVRLSFLDGFTPSGAIPTCDEEFFPDDAKETQQTSITLFCMNIGKEICVFTHDSQNIPIDRRAFKAAPTCHSFKPDCKDGSLLIGLANGEIQLTYPLRKDYYKVFNEDKTIDKTGVTCVLWVPNSPHQFLTSHSSGCLYLYDEKLLPVASPPSYDLFKEGAGFWVHTCKAKSTRNPIYRWIFGSPSNLGAGHFLSLSDSAPRNTFRSVISNGHSHKIASNGAHLEMFTGSLASSHTQSCGEDSAAINQFSFSPCGTYLALVTQDGYLRVLEYHEMELYGYMRSYFAGLLCVDWSGDGRFVVVGGQDDLVTVWSMAERAVICRGQGHRSWVSTVRFDPYLTPFFADIHAECCQSNGSSRCHTKATLSTNDVSFTTSDNAVDSNGHETTLVSRNYRIGSVGQDTMFCLWDLTEDIVRQGVLFIRESAMSLESHSSCKNIESSNAVTGCPNDATGPVGSSNSGRSSLRLTLSTKQNSRLSAGHNTVASVRSRNVSNLLGFLTLGKRRSTTHSGHIFSASTVGSLRRQADPSLSPSEERVTGYACNLPANSTGGDSPAQDRWNISNGVSSNSSSLCRPGDSSCLFDMNELSVFGSPMCPRFGDVPILEPLVCRTMHQHRLTDLIFRHNTVHVVCQQGLIRSWSRPSPSKESDYLDEPLIDDLGVPCAVGISDTGSFCSGSDQHSKRMDSSQSNLTSLT